MKKATSGNIFLKMHPVHRIMISVCFSVVAFFLSAANEDWLLRCIITWDVFALVYCLTCWIVLFTRNTGDIKKVATTEDGSRAYVIVILLAASFASMIMVMLLLLSDKATGSSKILYSLSAVMGMMLAWTMVHTTFAFHYAHLYYADNREDKNADYGGLEFPGNEKPDYLDFAYFSFVIGMTFQVSDVEISDRTLRRLSLLHSMLAFLLNTFVVALTINLVAGLKNG